MTPRKAPRSRTTPATTTTTTTPVTDAQLKTLVAQRVANVLAECEATKSRNGEDSRDSGTVVRKDGNCIPYQQLYYRMSDQVCNLYSTRNCLDVVELPHMSEESRVPIILGKPFLATTRAMIDVFNKKITLKVGDDEVVFDME
ncbi:hypothetical protein Tco_1163430 [Tanacetum coccineum]